MTYEISILCALLCLATHRIPATLGGLRVRVGGTEHDVKRAILTLANADLVMRTLAGPRLSLAGFAVAVACAAPMTKRGGPSHANVRAPCTRIAHGAKQVTRHARAAGVVEAPSA